MSILIKSNNALTNGGLGTVKMIGATAQAEFDKYKSRVLADGGTIKSETKTLEAFKLLFNLKLYGLMGTYVTGDFGVKVNSSSGIEKLYAIDGEDMTGVTYGSGVLPRLSESNEIDFSSNPAGITENLGILTTNKMPQTTSGSYAFFVKFSDATSPTGTARNYTGLTVHDDGNYQAPVFYSRLAGMVEVENRTTVQPAPLNPSIPNYENFVNGRIYANKKLYALYNNTDKVLIGNISGTKLSKNVEADLTGNYYLDLGGTHMGSLKIATDSKIQSFASFRHGVPEKVEAFYLAVP